MLRDGAVAVAEQCFEAVAALGKWAVVVKGSVKVITYVSV